MCLVCCGVRCGFVVRVMFGLSLPSVVCGRVRVLFVCLRMVVGGVCCVFVFLRLVYPMLPDSLDCQFCIAPSVFSDVY